MAPINAKNRKAAIVIVDPELKIEDALCQGLNEQGYELTVINDPTRTMTTLEMKPKHWSPMFIIVDLYLQKISAYEMVRKLVDWSHAKVPIVVMAKELCSEERTEAYSAGASAVIEKPIQIEAIRKIIEERKQAKARNQSQLDSF